MSNAASTAPPQLDPTTSSAPCFTIDHETKAALAQQLSQCVDILVEFRRPPAGKKQLSSRDRFNMYTGFAGALMGLLIAQRGLAAVAQKPIEELMNLHRHDRPGGADGHDHQLSTKHKVATFFNAVVNDMLDFVHNPDNLRDDCHTLLFGEFHSCMFALSNVAMHAANCLHPDTRVRLLRLLPEPYSVAAWLAATYPESCLGRIFPPEECEPFYGRCGLVSSMLHARDVARKYKTSEKDVSDEEILKKLNSHVRRLIEDVIASGKQQASIAFPKGHQQQHPDEQQTVVANPPSLCWCWHSTAYLGAAHGAAGICYYALHTASSLEEATRLGNIPQVLDTISNVAKFPDSENYRSSLRTAFDRKPHRESDRLVQFCHGAPGFVYAFGRAFELARLSQQQEQQQEHWRDKMLRAGECTWQRGLLTDSVGLCHSVSGNGYSLLCISRLLFDEEKSKNNKNSSTSSSSSSSLWWHRSVHFAKESVRIAPEVHREGDHIYSMFEGLAGTLAFVGHVLLASSQRSFDTVRFPGFELM